MTIDDKVHATDVTECICLAYLYLHDFVLLLESNGNNSASTVLHYQQLSSQRVVHE